MERSTAGQASEYVYRRIGEEIFALPAPTNGGGPFFLRFNSTERITQLLSNETSISKNTSELAESQK